MGNFSPIGKYFPVLSGFCPNPAGDTILMSGAPSFFLPGFGTRRPTGLVRLNRYFPVFSGWGWAGGRGPGAVHFRQPPQVVKRPHPTHASARNGWIACCQEVVSGDFQLNYSGNTKRKEGRENFHRGSSFPMRSPREEFES